MTQCLHSYSPLEMSIFDLICCRETEPTESREILTEGEMFIAELPHQFWNFTKRTHCDDESVQSSLEEVKCVCQVITDFRNKQVHEGAVLKRRVDEKVFKQIMRTVRPVDFEEMEDVFNSLFILLLEGTMPI